MVEEIEWPLLWVLCVDWEKDGESMEERDRGRVFGDEVDEGVEKIEEVEEEGDIVCFGGVWRRDGGEEFGVDNRRFWKLSPLVYQSI